MEGKLSGMEEAEYAGLRAAISQIENLLRLAPDSQGSGVGMLQRFVENAKSRMAAIEKHAQQEAEEQKRSSDQAAVAAMVEHERALNSAEKREYAGLLSHDFFSKADFGQLEHFYSHTWDKLTDEGKGEMSHRIWEGVRRGQYRFTDLPVSVEEGEAQQVQAALQDSRKAQGELSAIPEVDRTDFIRARDAGEKQQSYQILNRPSFTDHVAKTSFRDTTSKSVTFDSGRVAQDEGQKPAKRALEPAAVPDRDSKKIELADMNDVDGSALGLQPPLAGGGAVPVKTRQ